MKLRNHTERLNAIEKSEWYLIGLINVFVSVTFVYKSIQQGYIV